MIAILIATRAEAGQLLRNMHPVKAEGIFHYRGDFGGKAAALYLTRAGVASREQVRRFLRLYRFELVVSTGACASLTSEFRHLQSVPLRAAVNHERSWISFGDEGFTVVSVTHLVTTDTQKAELRSLTGAQLLDMETWTLASIMRDAEFATTKFVAVRIVDDLPGEDKYLGKEKQLRDLTARTPSGRPGWRSVVRFGLWDYAVIQMRRHRVATAIAQAVSQAIRQRT